jgi:hypothetical protein
MLSDQSPRRYITSSNDIQGGLELQWRGLMILLVGRLFRNIADAGLSWPLAPE